MNLISELELPSVLKAAFHHSSYTQIMEPTKQAVDRLVQDRVSPVRKAASKVSIRQASPGQFHQL